MCKTSEGRNEKVDALGEKLAPSRKNGTGSAWKQEKWNRKCLLYRVHLRAKVRRVMRRFLVFHSVPVLDGARKESEILDGRFLF